MKGPFLLASSLLIISSAPLGKTVFIFSPSLQAQTQNADRDREMVKANELTSEILKLYNAKRYREALPLAQKVIEIRRRLLLPDDASLGSALTNLAELYFADKKDDEAEKTFQQALGVYEQNVERNGIVLSKTLDRLGYLRFLKRDYDNAEPLYIRSLEIKEKALGPTNSTTIEAMKNYACLNLIARSDKYQMLQEEKDEAKGSLRAIAQCWLYGFKQDCQNEVYNPSVKTSTVLNGKAVKLGQPAYPREARVEGVSGRVFVAVRIDEEGKVVDARAVCGGHHALITASLEAARVSRFTQTIIDGKPIAVYGIITYNFVRQ